MPTKKIETVIDSCKKITMENKELFSKLNSLWLEDIKNINDEIHKDHNDIFLFGASSIFSQNMIFNGCIFQILNTY